MTRRVDILIATLGVILCLTVATVLSSRTIATPLVPPDAPILASPDHDSWTSGSDISFIWSEADRAMSYELRYAKTSDCSVGQEEIYPGYTGQFTAEDAVVVVALEPRAAIEGLTEGAWCWQVRAVSSGGYSAWSGPRTFHLDMTQPILVVKHPLVPGRFSGTVNERATIELILDDTPRPDIPVTISSVHNTDNVYEWSVTLPQLPSGDHTYVLRVVDTAGNEKLTAPASFITESPAVDKPHLVTNMQHEMLPLLPMGPLVFIASPARELADSDLMAPVIDDATATRSMAVEVPGRIERLAAAHIDVSATSHPVQPTGEGWLVFGVAWYWWGLGVGCGLALAWILFLRVRLAARLNWIGAV